MGHISEQGNCEWESAGGCWESESRAAMFAQKRKQFCVNLVPLKINTADKKLQNLGNKIASMTLSVQAPKGGWCKVTQKLPGRLQVQSW